jgi:hypothetical protein
MTAKDLHALYIKIGKSIPGSVESQLFGKPCFKVNGKAFICFFEDCMVFKLEGDQHKKAMALDGACLFDPSKKKRPMKEWVQLPDDYSSKWKSFAKAAFDYVEVNS